jgi:membrane protease YdiL (CAAX protease family)
VAVGGLAFSLLYLWRRNLWANIIVHFIADAMSVLARALNEEDCRQPFQRSSLFRVIAEKARDNL